MPKPRAQKRAEAEARAALTPPERRRAARRGCPSGKRSYPTERDARVELVGAGVDRNRGRCHRKECRAYLCPLCGSWHLTSAPLRKEGAA